MPASSRKDRITVIGVREVPAHLSKEVFEAKLRAFLDSLMTIPIRQTSFLSANIQALGLPEARPLVITYQECETADQLTEIYSDPNVARVVAQAEQEFGFCSTASTFFTAEVTKIDRPASDNVTRLFGVFKPPARLTSQELLQKLEGVADLSLTIPICQKVFTRYSIFPPSNVGGTNLQSLDTILRVFGLPVPEPMVVLMVEGTSVDEFKELLADPDYKKLAMEAILELELHTGGVGFVGEVESKV
ncbi:hypothetical protein C8R46DRAFT_1192973 [Mycena filopes]|nr:hypothetical protein C8R46DRAFT_1192973 [Mycena filopes]